MTTDFRTDVRNIVDKANSFKLQLDKLKQLNDALITKSEEIVESLDKMAQKTENNKCTVCYTRLKKVAFVPCGHLFCAHCADRAITRNRCFTCRGRIDHALTVFLG